MKKLLEKELLDFYGCKNCDYELAYENRCQLYITEFNIAKDIKTNKIFSFIER